MLKALEPTTTVTSDSAVEVAGRPAYELVLDPNDSNTLISQVRIAIDGDTKLPLRVQVFGTDNKIVFEVAYTSVDFTRPDDAEFVFNPPPGAKVTEIQPSDQARRARKIASRRKRRGRRRRSSAPAGPRSPLRKVAILQQRRLISSSRRSANKLQPVQRLVGFGSAARRYRLLGGVDRRRPAGCRRRTPRRDLSGPQQVTSAPADTAPVVTSGLTKRFRRQIAVDRIDLEVPGGAVYGFLGPNGSGKTTTIRMLLGLISPTAGEISLLGSPMPAAARSVLRRVGSLVEGPAFHPYLSGRANLARLDAADRYSDPRTSRVRIDAALDRVGLARSRGEALSGVLARHAPAIGDRKLAADAARPAGAGRTHQWARSAGHSRGPASHRASWRATAPRCWSRVICSPRWSRSAAMSG